MSTRQAEHLVHGSYRCSAVGSGIWRASLGRCLFPPLPALSYADVTASRPVPRFQLPPHRTQRADVGIAMRCARLQVEGSHFPLFRLRGGFTIPPLPAFPQASLRSRTVGFPESGSGLGPCTPFSDCMSSHALRNLRLDDAKQWYCQPQRL